MIYLYLYISSLNKWFNPLAAIDTGQKWTKFDQQLAQSYIIKIKITVWNTKLDTKFS
jgi:hypothetical protein